VYVRPPRGGSSDACELAHSRGLYLSRSPTAATTRRSADDYVVDLAAGVVTRTDGANSLDGSAGNDSIDRRGSDYIWGYSGNDTIETGDGAADRADGADADTCHADQLDELFACEAVTLAPAPSGTSGDRTAPECKVISATGKRA
jgi:RTX calcium-binding nonapeptide repeat (4 copies)